MRALFRLCLMLLIGSAIGGTAALAETYPVHPIRIVVPFPAGGPTDVVASAVAPKLSTLLDEGVTLDYIVGEDGIVGTAYVAKAAPDGYTLLLTPSSFTIHPGTYRQLPFDSETAFAPVSLLLGGAFVLVVNPSLPVESVDELIAYAKSHPGRLRYAAAGSGGPTQLGFELFKIASGTDIAPVTFNGGKAAVDAVASGKAQVMLAPLISAHPLIKDGRLRGLAVSSSTRAAAVPDLPTIADTLPGFTAVSWYGVLAPAGTPALVITQLSNAFDEIVHEPEIAKRFAEIGGEPVGGSPAILADVIRAEIARWRLVAKEAGVHESGDSQ
jgi:tripartite-type tricarboxylate transporter receptor subunit TctC